MASINEKLAILLTLNDAKKSEQVKFCVENGLASAAALKKIKKDDIYNAMAALHQTTGAQGMIISGKK